jgi:hypothetical protein
MLAIKRAQKIIKADITAPFSKLLANLIVSLETDQEFEIKQLFSLSYENFELVMEILKEWRIDRYYIGKAKLRTRVMPALMMDARGHIFIHRRPGNIFRVDTWLRG